MIAGQPTQVSNDDAADNSADNSAASPAADQPDEPPSRRPANAFIRTPSSALTIDAHATPTQAAIGQVSPPRLAIAVPQQNQGATQ